MHKITLFILAALFAVTLAGQYYVPRAYYTIDAEGHESVRVPLRRLRRSIAPWGYPYSGADANANANANADAGGGGSANANANANAYAGARGNGGGSPWGGSPWAGNGGWRSPAGAYGSSNPARSGVTRRQYGTTLGQSVSASTSVGVDSSGQGYYDQTASVN